MSKGKKRRAAAQAAKRRRKARMPDGDGLGQSRYAKKRRGEVVPTPNPARVWCPHCVCRMCLCKEGDA